MGKSASNNLGMSVVESVRMVGSNAAVAKFR